MDAETVALRAVCLKAVATYALALPDLEELERAQAAWTPPEVAEWRASADAQADDFWEKVRRTPAWARLTPDELAFARKRCGELTAEDQIRFSWRVEAYQALLWALALLPDLPPLHQLAPREILDLRAAGILSAPRLRPAREVEARRESAELWHWRSRTRRLFGNGDPEIRTTVRETAAAALARGEIEEVVDGDFGLRGVAYHALPEEEWWSVASITAERHSALNWLCGYAPGDRWDETPTDT